jgi:hypothetical protein
MFLDYSQTVSGSETVQANILNVLGCGAGGGNPLATAAPVPIRLIQKAN